MWKGSKGRSRGAERGTGPESGPEGAQWTRRPGPGLPEQQGCGGARRHRAREPERLTQLPRGRAQPRPRSSVTRFRGIAQNWQMEGLGLDGQVEMRSPWKKLGNWQNLCPPNNCLTQMQELARSLPATSVQPSFSKGQVLLGLRCAALQRVEGKQRGAPCPWACLAAMPLSSPTSLILRRPQVKHN